MSDRTSVFATEGYHDTATGLSRSENVWHKYDECQVGSRIPKERREAGRGDPTRRLSMCEYCEAIALRLYDDPR